MSTPAMCELAHTCRIYYLIDPAFPDYRVRLETICPILLGDHWKAHIPVAAGREFSASPLLIPRVARLEWMPRGARPFQLSRCKSGFLQLLELPQKFVVHWQAD